MPVLHLDFGQRKGSLSGMLSEKWESIKSIVSGLGVARRPKVSDEISRVKCVTSTNVTTTECDHGSPPVVVVLVRHRPFSGACYSLITRRISYFIQFSL